LVNGGVVVLSRDILSYLPTPPASIERDVFPKLAALGILVAKNYQRFFIDIGLPETLELAQSAVPAWRAKSAILLDRDGVLNIDHGYVCTPERFEWTPGAVAAVRSANDAGVLVLVVTNQAGIARGRYTQAEFHHFMEWMNMQLRSNGAHLDGWYHCPHHPNGVVPELTVACQCRKPEPGMVAQAITEWGLEPRRCVMIGDKDSDIEAANRCGVFAIRFDSGHDNLQDLLANVALPMICGGAAPRHSGLGPK
jgi:D-glycero-D-manno-heptose 1,7-bisphosphate phosphatase